MAEGNSEELQFDSLLGGDQNLPERLTLLYFTSARAKEIQEMKQTLKAQSGTKMAFQRLPIHMRRRLMSHNAKRLPRRLREIHLSQLTKSGLPPKQKRPSRKYRRRPSNLIEEYAKRQRNCNWLETHIWHAKRFHMVQKWGYKLPDRPCDKAFRACYRATARQCCVQDISYFRCVEISGMTISLIERFKTICDNRIGLSIGAKAYIHGAREGQVMLFNNTQGIKQPVGSVNFCWKPSVNLHRVLWLWIHTAHYVEILNLLKDHFSLKTVENNMYVNNDINVSLTEIDLNRFRLTGPTSFNVLKSMLQVAPESCNSVWLKKYLVNSSVLFKKQCKYWNNVQPSEFPAHQILCLNVGDPRYNMPKSRTKPTSYFGNANTVEVPENAALGPIWKKEIRAAVKLNKISNYKLNEMRSELLVPGTELQHEADIVPVMIIQKPGNQKSFLGYGSGWDLVVPSGWGNTFWISLIMWGARAGGLREYNSIRFESGLPPYLEPDTQAGIEEQRAIKEKYEEQYFSLPPNKRPNYTKLSVVQPFSLNWKMLIKDWNPNFKDNFQVLREKNVLKSLQDFISNKIGSLDIEELSFLVPVWLKLEQRGIAKNFALICLPKSSDLSSKQMVMEPLKQDTNQTLRKEMRRDHKVLLKKMRRQRILAKQNNKIIPRDLDMLKIYKEKMQRLWLPPINEGLRSSCSREVMGFVVSANFSFLQAKSCAIGYIAIGAVRALGLNNCRNKVLVRNITSRVYRTALLEVIV